MVVVLVDKITPRIEYTFDFIFKNREVEYRLTSNIEEYQSVKSAKLNYSNLVSDDRTVIPSGLLTESEIRSFEYKISQFQENDCLSFDGNTDIIASVFYVLTRYEEYTCNSKDKHGRFPANESVLIKFNWIEKCVCDRWAMTLIHFSGALESVPKFNVELIPTFDIDNTFAYKWKDGWIKWFSICKDLFHQNAFRIKERKEVLTGQKKDPYDTFDRIREIGKSNGNAKVFWLVGKRKKKDRNISILHPLHREFISEINADIPVNLHPSYYSNGDRHLIEKEKHDLESILDRKVKISRQHYLRFSLPKTFNSLIEAGFTDEYSMGFAERVGFRSGTARSHKWFNLETNTETVLTIHPFAYMDGTLNEYMKLTIEQSKQKINELFTEVLMYGGNFVFIWHNETIGDYKSWEGWSDVLNYTLKLKNE